MIKLINFLTYSKILPTHTHQALSRSKNAEPPASDIDIQFHGYKNDQHLNEFTDTMILSSQDEDESTETINCITYPYARDRAYYCLTRSESAQNNVIQDPWAPFSCEEHFNFAAFLKRIKCPSHEIDKLFKVKMPLDASLSKSFRSAYTFNKRVEEMSDGLGWQSWEKSSIRLQLD